jgi:hypothetical protein
MARIILCPDFEHFTHLTPAIRRAMEFASKHGNAAYVLMEAVAGREGERAASAFLDALWSTDPDRREVLESINQMLAILGEVSDATTYLPKSSRLDAKEIPTGVRWLGARMEELKAALK